MTSAGPWERFEAGFREAARKLRVDLDRIFTGVEQLLELQLAALSAAPAAEDDLEALLRSRERLGLAGLLEVVEGWGRLRAHRRALFALENFDRTLDELTRLIPERAASLEELKRQLGVDRLGWRPLFRGLRPRQSLRWALRRLNRSRLTPESELFRLLAASLLLIGSAWERRCALFESAVLQGEAGPAEPLQHLIHEAQRLREGRRKALARWEAWATSAPERLRRALTTRSRARPDDSRRGDYVDLWNAQARFAETQVRVLQGAERVWSGAREVLAATGQQLASELEGLLQELAALADWLREASATARAETLPSARATVLSAPQRLQSIRQELASPLDLVPWSVELLPSLRLHPARLRWRTVAPRDLLAQAWDRRLLPALEPQLEEVESEHRKILAEIDRARDVVRYALELVGEGAAHEVAQDAIVNALSLLEFYAQERPDWRDQLEAAMSLALVRTMRDYRLRLGRDRLGLLAHLARQTTLEGLQEGWRASQGAFAGGSRRLQAWGRRHSDTFLVSIGWKQAPASAGPQLSVRPYLPEEYIAEPGDRDLPAIYQRLFRLTPVEDARFLVGRTAELQALREALELWRRGRPVAILLSGHRGTGKSSLLNCAEETLWSGLPVVRGGVGERLQDAAGTRRFLAGLLGLEPGLDPVPQLLEREPGVVIVEEGERTFLRRIGSFAGMKELRRVMGATSRRLLWLFCCSEVSLSLVSAVLGLQQSFSHRITSLTVPGRVLREAILVRHNLSGLRLRFAEKVEPRGWLRRRRGASPEEQFFRELARRSGGVFRTGFELWMGHIDSIEGVALYMRPLLPARLRPVTGDLDLGDLFTLVAVLQHGSLTVEEHAQVFSCPEEASATQLQELVGRELLEPDPIHPGLRVRPEAMPVVFEALYLHNLL